MANRHSTTKGFARTSSLLQTRIRKAGESRGFAVTRLLTHWAEVVGDDVAAIARPVDVNYGRKGGFGATLTLLTTGAQAPMLEMQKERIRERVNGVYGYNAIARIRITQTAPVGFAEGQASFSHRKADTPKAPDPSVMAEAQALAHGAKDDSLRHALETLARNVLSKSKN
ncbi:DUF721 domain-containing protein [Thalassovita sp.]|uniref:DUF721 domain-containing protein n=1 Tax=Thalassovita sp. TaxID=1979401 RepID=UPI0029DE549F|nr:DciA family protein [Thalassovita sp.]